MPRFDVGVLLVARPSARRLRSQLAVRVAMWFCETTLGKCPWDVFSSVLRSWHISTVSVTCDMYCNHTTSWQHVGTVIEVEAEVQVRG